MQNVYLARELWALVSRYPEGLPCIRCGQPAQYVQAFIAGGEAEARRVKGHFQRASAYCRTHAQSVAGRRRMPLVDTEEALFALIAALEAEAREAQQLREAAQQLREAAQLAEFGRILQLSGMKGRLYRLADGSPECEMNDGARIRPCCWAEGARLIDNRIADAPGGPGHSKDCPTHQHGH